MKIVVAEKRANGDRYYRVCIDETVPVDQQTFEEFTWGADVAEVDAEREMVGLLQHKYLDKSVEKLAVEGKKINLNAGIIVRRGRS